MSTPSPALPSVLSTPRNQPSPPVYPSPDPRITAETPEALQRELHTHIRDAAQLLHKLVGHCQQPERARWLRHEKGLAALQRALERTSGGETLRPGNVPDDGELDPQRVAEFGDMLLKARQALGLSQSQLATRAGLAKKTIWNVEHGIGIPARDTIFRLLFVKELGLQLDQIPWRNRLPADAAGSLNCWIAPGFEPLEMFAELQEAVNGPGGRLEQTFAYLDIQSAANWYKLCNQPMYVLKYRSRAPIESITRTIVDTTQHARIDFTALGAGDGMQETRLVQGLLLAADPQQRPVDIRCLLLDISQPLLSEAFKHASRALSQHGHVYVQAIQGNFHHWPRYSQLHHHSSNDHRRHVVALFGSTIGNLDNEATFFQHTLVGLLPNDLLLLDVPLAYADPSRPEEVLRKDPAFKHGPSEGHQAWLTGPLRSYCKDVHNIQLRYELNTLTVIPGSYFIDVAADVEFRDRTRKHFPSVFRFKRYDPLRLAATLRTFGWELIETRPYGPEGETPPMALMLFRKTAASVH